MLAAVNYSIEQCHGGDLDLHDDFVNETYITGFTDGDGSISTRHKLAISNKPGDLYPRPYKEFLQNKSFLVGDIAARRLVGEQ